MSSQLVGEHEFEAADGLPQALPSGERLLWQGRPDPWLLARHALHGDLVAAYFVVLIGWQVASAWADGAGPAQLAAQLATALPMAVLGLGLLGLIAWLMARTATYTLTDQRIVMSIGIVLSVAYNLPLSQIVAADLRLRRGGSGDIALTLADGQRIAWLHLWPHVRPWRVARTQPMLRGLPDAREVGAVLARAAREHAATRPAAARPA
ncbi:photosynthetic complex putative assembly protein PuhB [Piscinibacter sakaiensis]|uniref:Putative photosynthetic complex assembly protein n=1 Tax=Piscinibacter sakaiensis TaxID=1547922 RepID=A0A0K8NVF9_PISS1|nr:photosynthetic complex putative assembly protein PuhB [Piscinibacter sakaiensis]GAP34381.1 putative photosynthetic complex assembly protein [Piscinibacter sakaiensis]